MALWFSGAETSYKPAGGGFKPNAHRGRNANGFTMNAQTETIYKPHGKAACENAAYCNPAKTCLDIGALEERNTWVVAPGDDVKRGKRIIEKPRESAITPRRVAHGSAAPPQSNCAPFATGDKDSKPLAYHQQKKHVSPPKSTQRKNGTAAEDIFVPKRSRTPPASERNRPKTEGFCVLHGFDARVGKFTREMMRVAPAKEAHHGTTTFEWEKELVARREKKEDHRLNVLAERGRLARDRDLAYHANDEKNEAKPRSMKGRACTPTATSRRTPFAINLPTPVRAPECTSIPKWRN